MFLQPRSDGPFSFGLVAFLTTISTVGMKCCSLFESSMNATYNGDMIIRFDVLGLRIVICIAVK